MGALQVEILVDMGAAVNIKAQAMDTSLVKTIGYVQIPVVPETISVMHCSISTSVFFQYLSTGIFLLKHSIFIIGNRTECFKCHEPKGDAQDAPADSSGGFKRQNDWICTSSSCAASNFGNR